MPGPDLHRPKENDRGCVMMRESIYFVAAYLRLSREDHAKETGMDMDGGTKAESNSISSQRELIRSYIREHDDMELFDIYVEMKIA